MCRILKLSNLKVEVKLGINLQQVFKNKNVRKYQNAKLIFKLDVVKNLIFK